MEFKQIEAFVNVVKYGGFSRAADASFLTQSTISTHVANLEKELGTRLIDRSGGAPTLTPQGKIFYNHALNLLNIRKEATLSLQSFSDRMEGVVELQASSIPGQYLAPELIAAFQKRHSGVLFYLEQSDSRQAAKNLLARRGELGLLGQAGDGNLEYHPLLEDQMVLITPDNETFRSMGPGPVEPASLMEFSFLWREQGSATRQAYEESLAAIGLDPKRFRIVFRSNSMEAIKEGVRRGMGVSVISRLAAGGEGLLTFPVAGLPTERRFYLAHRKDAVLSPVAEAFRVFVLEYFKEKQEK
ncbi:MAG: selenium metabolism-associated LysR family transcriptional regulator [Bacillota bacterium]|nr:selenium metabolism-associated LysR family transcriptional regulator [Bacillota bacterium]